MTAPLQAAVRFIWGLGLGSGLGVLYGFLRPLRPRWTAFTDLLTVAAALWAWIWLSFGICRGDIRLGATAALGLGAFLWELTAGRLLRPVFRLFWQGVQGIFSIFFMPFQKILQIFSIFLKKVFASVKKMGTIYWNSRRQHRRRSGGNHYEKADQSPFQHHAGISPREDPHQDCTAGCYRTVYGGTGDDSLRH
jgi:hypothetical protein